MRQAFRWLLLVVVALSCGGGGCSGCSGFTRLPQGSYQGPRFDTAGAIRLPPKGLAFLNAHSSVVLDLFAPGNTLNVHMGCSEQTVSIANIPALKLKLADSGAAGCTTEACGRLDGVCDARDVGHDLSIFFNSLSFSTTAPDLLVANANAVIKTGLLPVAEVSPSALCLFNGRAKCTVDLDTTRASPPNNDLAISIQLVIDPRWDKLTTLTVTDVGGAKACSIGSSAPACLDPSDIIIANEGGCGACSTANFVVLKALIVDQVAKSLKTQINKALSKATCAQCDSTGICPHNATATSTCNADAGVCMDGAKCAPALLGLEGRLGLGTMLAKLGAPGAATVDLTLGAGGAVAVGNGGLTLGLRGGAQERSVATCVKPLTAPARPALPLPDIDSDAPAPFDLGVTLSQQLVSEVLFRAQQSGALCLGLTHDTVGALESGTLGPLLPSLQKLTHGEAVPLTIVIRPVNPPTATIGQGTFTASGAIAEPILRLDWPRLELDLYARLEDRDVRLFTIAVDVALPLGLRTDGCNGITPIVGDLMNAFTNVHVVNSEVLAEPTSALETLVPTLLTFAEPALAKGLSKVTVPDLQGFALQWVGARGVAKVTGTSSFTHLGLFANLTDAGTTCTPTGQLRVAGGSQVGASLAISLPPRTRVSFRVDGGLWSQWLESDAAGQATLTHPALLLGGGHLVEFEAEDGRTTSLRTE